MIDAGTKSDGASVVKQLLKEEGGMTLEYVISAHPESDHAGGLQEVFEHMKVKTFFLHKMSPTLPPQLKELFLLQKKNLIVHCVTPRKAQ